MTRYTLHVPEQYNDGAPVGPETFAAVEERILSTVGGYTLAHGIGAWRSDEGRDYREAVRLYLIDADESARQGLLDLAHAVARALDQEAVYLTEQPVAPTLVYPSLTPA